MKPCSFEGCDQPCYTRRAWCNKHYFQRYRNGQAGLSKDRGGRTWGHSQGYRLVTRIGHPLAQARGAVYEHRLALWDRIGPGTHPCHWCGSATSWDKRHPEPGALEVDHLDDDRTNNAPFNLVPACHSCNTRRALARRWSA